MNVSTEVMAALRKVSQTDEVDKNPNINLFDTGLLDSLALVELLVEIEARLGVELSPSEVDRDVWATPQRIIDYLVSRMER